MAPWNVNHLYSKGITDISTTTTQVFHLKLVPIATCDNDPLDTSAKSNSSDCCHTQLAYMYGKICMRVYKKLQIPVFYELYIYSWGLQIFFTKFSLSQNQEFYENFTLWKYGAIRYKSLLCIRYVMMCRNFSD